MRGVPLSIQYLYIGNTAQERPSHPSIFSAGRAKPLSTSPGSPNVFTTDQPPPPPITLLRTGYSFTWIHSTLAADYCYGAPEE